MEKGYAIALFNREEDYIIKPFLSNVPKIDKLIIIANKNSEHEESKRRLINFLDEINIAFKFVYVNDITNFFQTFFTVRALCMQEGPPVWVNASCGSGIGMAALAIHAIKHNVKMVVFEKDEDRTAVVDVKKLQKINILDHRYLNIMKNIANGKNTISKLAYANNIDKSSVSRYIKNLISMEIVKKLNEDNKNKPYIFCLTEFGKTLLPKF
ncbi:MAG: DUF6293 family protein [Thermoplasmata archaeon]